MDARSLAVFGASDRTLTHQAALRNVARAAGPVYGVNPTRERALEVVCYPEAAALPTVPDVALMMVPDRALPAAVRDALDVGIRSIVVPGLDDGLSQHDEVEALARMARDAGAGLLGPNCMGVAVPGGSSAGIGSRR